MRYKGKVYRPPSEAYSLIIQVTYGCSHNRCAFCDMYDDKRFALRPMEEIREDFRLARQVYRRVERVFLADGDALMRKTDELLEILAMVYSLFPECQRVTCYASPRSLQVKTEEELRRLRESGLKMVYMGLESGCDAVLEWMQKGHTAAAIVAAGQKARRAGLALSVTAISGLGSRELLGNAAGALGPGGQLPGAGSGGNFAGDGPAAGPYGQPGQRVPDEPCIQLSDPEGNPEPGSACSAAAGAGGTYGTRPAAGELACFVNTERIKGDER